MPGLIDLKRTPVTTLLLVAIAAMFAIEVASGGSDNSSTLLRLGANYPPLVAQGEYWRLITCMFLHIGILHLLLNGWALYQLGSLYETLIGSLPMLGVYFVTGIAASLASFFFTRSLSAGASGAIFGLLGALITFLARRRRSLLPAGRGLLGQLLGWAALNVLIGTQTPGIDNAGHLGGCAVGLVLGLLLQGQPRTPPVPAPAPPSAWPPPPSQP